MKRSKKSSQKLRLTLRYFCISFVGTFRTVPEPTSASSDTGAVSAGGVYQLLRDAQQLHPAVAELELLEATARARPGTPDNAPLLGRVSSGGSGQDVEGLIIATGFFRHGVLLTPAAGAICRDLLDGQPDPRWAGFRPDRFSGPHDSSSHRLRDASPADASATDRTPA